MQGSAEVRRVVIADSNAMLLRVPFWDPDYEIWGLNAMQRQIPRWDRWFEIHDDFREQNETRPHYAEWLTRNHGRPIYMIEPQPDIPSSVRYPLGEIEAEFGVDYWCNSLAYMVALAVYEQVDEIYLYGMNEFDRDRCERAWRNITFWLGVAKGRGIKVWVHPASEFLRSFHGDEPDTRYGYATPVRREDPGFRLTWTVDRSLQAGTRRAFVEVRLRPATMWDCWRVYRWRNLPEIVALGSTQRRVRPWEHWLWFLRMVKSDDCLMWIVQAHVLSPGPKWMDCGVARVTLKLPFRFWPPLATITIYLLPGWTGTGIGVEAIREACQQAESQWGPVKILAHIRHGNARSERAFRKAGFETTGPTILCPPGHWEMVWCETN